MAVDILDREYRKSTGLTDHDLSMAEAVFDDNAETVICPACGRSFAPTSRECPECGLAFG